MSKDKISDYSATANSNTDIAGINIDEGCAPSGINNAIRTLMKQLKDFQQGTNSDSFNGPVNGTVGATTPAAGTFTTVVGTDTTDASSTTAAAMKTAGGLAVAKKLYVGTGGAVVDGLTVGKGAGAVSTNTAVGASALASNSTGANETAIGYQALYSTTANNNTGVGYQAGYSNNTGFQNVFMGNIAGYSNTSGAYNTALGAQALNANTTASNNTSIGYKAGYSTTTGAVTAVGSEALRENTTGVANIAIGGTYTGVSNAALIVNTTGGYNTAVGVGSLQANTTASYNTAVGYQAGYTNSTGAGNTFLGYTAGYSTTGSYNSFFGPGAGYSVTSGTKNTIIGGFNGNQGGLNISTSSNNIVLSDGDGNLAAFWDNTGGAYSGQYNINTRGAMPTGGKMLANGHFIAANGAGGTDGSTDSKNYGFGFGATGSNNALAGLIYPNYQGSWGCDLYVNLRGSGGGTSNNRFQISNAGACYNSTGTYGTISDINVKDNIVPAPNYLDRLMQVEIVKYSLKEEHSEVPTKLGVVAQQVEQIFPNIVELTNSSDENGELVPTKAVKYSVFVPMLIKAIQELNAKVEAQAAEIAALKGQA